MSASLLDEPAVEDRPTPRTRRSSELTQAATASSRLRATMAATRVSITWLGVRKTLTPAQKEQAADTFGAEGGFVSAGKKLLDTSAPAFKLVTSVRGRAVAYWKGLTLPFPEPGIRLIRQSDVDLFTRQMAVFQTELGDAVSELNAEYGDLKRAAANRLGSLYNPADYPTSLLGLFSIEYDFPSVEPPDYLRQLRPDLYEQECARVQQRFNEAVELAEQAFVAELQRLVSHLSERLTGEQDGRPKVFRDSAVENLTDFFDRFRRLNIRSNGDLDEVVRQAQHLLGGLSPQTLRDNSVLRQSLSQELGQVQTALDDLMVDRPRRNILRRPR